VSYLVAFVADPAGDRHADAFRVAARAVEGAGFFDDPEGGDERTVGVYVRAGALGEPAARGLIEQARRVSRELPARLEVQHGGEILGHVSAGEPDERLAAALRTASAGPGTA
jgi:hypothetical protein